MELDLRDLYDLETVISESLLIESTEKTVVAWVSGTAGGFAFSRSGAAANGTLTLEVQLLVPQSIHDDLEEKLSKYYDLDKIEPDIASMDPNSPDSIRPYDNVEQFIEDSLSGSKKGELIREWCRYYPPHTNPLAEGLCPTMDETEFLQWAAQWRAMGYSNEGSWIGGAARHTVHDDTCPWCAARFKKGVATGSPSVPAPPLAPDTRRKIMGSRFGAFGRSCGDPVRPVSFRTQEVGIEGGRVEVRGKKNTKLWYSSRFKNMAQILMKKYRRKIIEAIDSRLGIPEGSPLYQLIFGERTKKKPIPSNFKIYLSDGRSSKSTNGDGRYMTQAFGQVQDLQALLYNSYSPDAPGPQFTQYLVDKQSGKEKREKVSWVNLDKLETHFVYNYLVDIYLDQSVVSDDYPADKKVELDNPDEPDDNLSQILSGFSGRGGHSEPVTTPKFDTFMNRLASIIEEAIPDRVEEHGYWVDTTGHVFTILKIPTGLEGLNFLIDPFFPMKKHELEQWREVAPEHYNMMKLLPAVSPAWEMGGRNNSVMLETLNYYLNDNFNITLAPYDQFKPYPIGPDGTIYIIKEDDAVVTEDGTIVGNIIDEEGDTVEIEQLVLERGESSDDIAYQGLSKKKNRKIVRKIISIRKDDILGTDEINIEGRTFADLAGWDTTSDEMDDEVEKQDLQIAIPNEEYLDRLAELHGEKFVDREGVIDADNPGEVYDWNDPRLWSKELITRLATPREYVDRRGDFFHLENGEYVSADIGQVYPWYIIEDRSHPFTPYVQSDGGYVHALDDIGFQRQLEIQGMSYNPLTRQWESQTPIEFHDASGVKKTKWVKPNEALFWMYHAGKRYDELPESFSRTTAITGNAIKGVVRGPEDVQIGIDRGTKEWRTLNNRRIRKSNDLFPSPFKMLNPPVAYWEEINERFKLPIPPNAFAQAAHFKAFWPCREACGGAGCEYCEQDFVQNSETKGSSDPLTVRAGGQTIRRDLWTGLEWLSYLSALQFWDNSMEPDDERKLGKERIRSLWLNFYKDYDLHCLQNKVVREKGQPVDLSNLSEVDKLMMVVNWQGMLPKTFDTRLSDDFITGMRSIYTEMFYRAMPEAYREIVNNTTTGEEYRPDLLIDEISYLDDYADRTAHLATLSQEELKQQEAAVKRRNARRLAKTEASTPSELKKPTLEAEDTFVPDDEPVQEQYDPEVHTVEARIKDEEDPEDDDPTEIDNVQSDNDFLQDYLANQEADPETGEEYADLDYRNIKRDMEHEYDELDREDTGDADEAALWLQHAEKQRDEAEQASEVEKIRRQEAEERQAQAPDGDDSPDISQPELDMPGGDFDMLGGMDW